MTWTEQVHARLVRLKDDELERFRDGDTNIRVTVKLADVATSDRRELQTYLGRHDLITRNRVSVPLVDLDAALRARANTDVFTYVAQRHGPVVRHAEKRAARDEATSAFHHSVENAFNDPAVAAEAVALPLRGISDRVRHIEHLRAAYDAVRSDHATTLAGIARAAGLPPHALDLSKTFNRDVLALLEAAEGRPAVRPDNVAHQRRLWRSHGVICDELSVTVFAVGLPLATDHPETPAMQVRTSASDAHHFTLRSLERTPIELAQPTTVTVVENPSVVTDALHRYGADIPPMVCSSGWPNTAAVTLLEQLRHAGATLRYHGDFDPDGLQICRYLADTVTVVPWLMSADDYLRHLPPAGDGTRWPAGKIIDTTWDPALAEQMRSVGRPVYEEDMTATILEQLR